MFAYTGEKETSIDFKVWYIRRYFLGSQGLHLKIFYMVKEEAKHKVSIKKPQ